VVGNILKIKTSIPPQGLNIISRHLILERLRKDLTVAEGFTRGLTLFSAPAGYGKTTTARHWLIGQENRTAWYSLDETDNDPELFWIYLITALQNISEDTGKGALEMLRSGTAISESVAGSEPFLTPLLNDLFALDSPAYLVLDDYHLINDNRIQKTMVFFVENLPPTLHLIITTRSDPPWPLSRWRARGIMTEIRLEQLKFSEEEAAHLLAETGDIRLDKTQLHTLCKKIEGWVTGLQLAGTSLSASGNIEGFIETFAGTHRHIFQFLSEEAYANQPGTVQEFLMQTSVLNRFSASLCDAVTGIKGSSNILTNLERNNLFVIPLDEEGIWYQYHPLFADMLFYKLKNHYPEEISVLHEKACRWFVEAGEPGEALRHALKGGNNETAALILNNHIEELLPSEGLKQIIHYLKSFSPELLKKYPRLIAHKAWLHLIDRGKEEAGVCLDLAGETGFEDKKGQEELTGMLAVVKTYYYIYNNDFKKALEYAEKAMELLSADNYYWRTNVAIISGDARLFSGNPKGALPFYREAYHNRQKYGNEYLIVSAGFKVATCLYFQGKLKESEELARELLQTAKDKKFPGAPRIGLIWTMLGELLREKGNLEEAEKCVERGLLLSEPEKPSLGWNYLFRVALSFSQQDYIIALETVSKIETLHREVKLPAFITIPAATWKARILLEQGEEAQALEVLDKAGITEKTVVKGGKEWGHLILTSIMIVKSKDNLNNSFTILNQIEELAIRGDNQGILLETLLLKARLEYQTGNFEAADTSFYCALETGKESGYFQLFIDQAREPNSVFCDIAERIKNRRPVVTSPDLLEFIGTIEQKLTGSNGSPGEDITFVKAPEKQEDSFAELIEELTSRELEILNYISHGLTNQEIARKLFLSPGTVKWHTSNIYGKLGVRGRLQAVALARELKLIS
jgi:LuxR family transcriptional regulator, maltose regulon positive regulatory protein